MMFSDMAARTAPEDGSPAARECTYIIEDAKCGGCKSKIEAALAKQPGILAATLDLDTKRLRVIETSLARANGAVIASLTALGFEAKAETGAGEEEGSRSTQACALASEPQPAPSGTPEGTRRLQFAVQGATCASCMLKIERGIGSLAGVSAARYNLSRHRLAVDIDPRAVTAADILHKLDALGYRARPFSEDEAEQIEARQEKRLLTAMAVAGFAAANIMLLSVSVWSGNAADMDPETRTLFHWFSALIALPAAAYAGQPFFSSALGALQKRRLNMDVPISLAVILALAMSVLQTINHARDAYFDSAVMLLFFLLIGRFLDARSRRTTRNLGANLLALQRPTSLLQAPDGTTTEVPTSEVRPGDLVLVTPGSRFAVDGVVASGNSTVDASLITGESEPVFVGAGDRVYAGTLNLSGALTVTANAAGADTLLSEISQLMDEAAEKRGAYIRLADRAAQIYAPAVHLLALVTFLGWLGVGAGWQPSLLNAIAVLLITCPCALGLAVPVVQVVATGALFRSGVLVNSGDALERLARADVVVFDKTGTLTEPEPGIVNEAAIAPQDIECAARLALSSRHVLARVLARHAAGRAPFPGAQELPGAGVQAEVDGTLMKLGSRVFCGVDANAETHGLTELVFRKGDAEPVVFRFAQRLRADATEVIHALKRMGLRIEMLSGDRKAAVAQTAKSLGIERWQAEAKPQEKIAYIERLRAEGHEVAMIGDGLNDAAALQAANVSLAPATALDITQAAADIVIVGHRLAPVAEAIRTAKRARRLMAENIGFAAAYNVIAVPLAVAGFVTPLIAAVAMSGSSIVVTLNALRARLQR